MWQASKNAAVAIWGDTLLHDIAHLPFMLIKKKKKLNPCSITSPPKRICCCKWVISRRQDWHRATQQSHPDNSIHLPLGTEPRVRMCMFFNPNFSARRLTRVIILNLHFTLATACWRDNSTAIPSSQPRSPLSSTFAFYILGSDSSVSAQQLIKG